MTEENRAVEPVVTLPYSVATFNTPAGWLQRCTLRDDQADHQIRITCPNGGIHIFVSCPCRARGQHIAEISTAEEALIAYRSYHLEMI